MWYKEIRYRKGDFISSFMYGDVCTDAPETLVVDSKREMEVMKGSNTHLDIYETPTCEYDCNEYMLAKHCNCTLSGPLKKAYNDGPKCNLTGLLTCDFAMKIVADDA